MNKGKTVFFFIVFIFSFLWLSSAATAQVGEDTAHLKFEKNADHESSGDKYIVKKGDWLANIIRQEMKVQSYAQIDKAIRQIKRHNPKIKNVDVIQPGQVLNIPPSMAAQLSGASPAKIEARVDTGDSGGASSNGSVKPALFVKNNENIALLKQIIANLNGSLMTSGLYHIPLPRTGQITIDCEKIAVAEFEDGTTSIIDFSNTMPLSLRALIKTSWKNYRVINCGSGDSIVTILQKIIGSSKSYKMIKMAKLFSIPGKPVVQFYADWVIAKKSSGNKDKYVQALSFLKDDSQLLPAPLVHFAEKNALIFAQVVDQREIMQAKAPDEYALNISNLNSSSNSQLIAALLSVLRYEPVKDSEVKVYDKIKKEGYNLEVKVDYLLKKDDGDFIISSNPADKEISTVLKEAGYHVFSYDEKEAPQVLIDRLLRNLNIPFTFENFSFPIPEKGAVRATINFPAFRITDKQEEPVFMTGLKMDSEIYHLIHGIWRLKLVTY